MRRVSQTGMTWLAIRSIIVALVILLSAALAQAGETKLSGAQITDLLSGNTAIGNQNGMMWRQFFSPNGNTLYLASGSQPSPGKWKVAGERYCSLWPPSTNWDCYDMTGEGDNVTWVFESGGEPWPAKMVPGNQSGIQ